MLTSLFNLLALVYIGRAIQLAAQLVRQRAALRQEPLTRAKQHLAEQAAFFIAVPVSVLVHEGAHALAVLAFGGDIVEFGYRVFWGFVSYNADLTPAQHWFVALAGTLGSLAFGVAVWLLLRRGPSRTIRYFGLRALRFQLYFSLLYYPLISIPLPIGDWQTIYAFGLTPLLSGLTAVAHVGLLWWFWRADQAGAFEMVAYENVAAQRHAEMLAAAGDPVSRLAIIAVLRQGGARHQARRAIAAFQAEYPRMGEGYLQLALWLADGRGGVEGHEVAEAARQAVALGLQSPGDVVQARRLAAAHELQRGDGLAAQKEIDAALAPAGGYSPEMLHPLTRAELHALRANALRRQQRFDEARAELGVALSLAEDGPPGLVQRLRDEAALIDHHTGDRRGLDAKGDSLRA